jgi:hypothetical protein
MNTTCPGSWDCRGDSIDKVKDTERYTIETGEEPSTVRRRIRVHLRTPLVGTAAASVGIRTGDMVVGFVVGNRFRARLFPENTPSGRVRDALLVKGRIDSREHGGSRVQLAVGTPQAFQRATYVVLGVLLLLFVVGYIATTWRPFLFAVGFLVLWAVFSASVTRLNKGSEANERALFRRWVTDVARDLGARPDGATDELGATGARQGR